jgi:TonB-linked SusC/RagA family outer membrane protein
MLLIAYYATNRLQSWSLTKKLLLIMKFTAFILLVACMQVSARGRAQNVSISVSNTSIKKVFQEVKKQTGYDFFYDKNDLQRAGTVSLKLNNVPLDEALRQCLKNQPLTYTIIEKTIIVRKKEDEKNDDEVTLPLNSQPVTNYSIITGHVTDSKNKPLNGASVTIKGSQVMTSTDAAGSFKIPIASSDAVLVVSYVGYTSREIPVKNNNDLQIVLQEANSEMNQVVVIGYGTQKAKDITSAVSTLPVSDIKNRPISLVADAMMGKATGVQVLQPSGKPGGDFTVLVRGMSSVTGGSQPLYVVDGVIVSNVSYIDPANIESISVLKDAAAAGIYGAAGSTNGVVLIKTKQGVKGKARVDANVYYGQQQLAKKLPVLNNTQLKDLLHDVATNGGQPVPDISQYLGNNNDWQDLVYRKAPMMGVNLSTSGGGEKGNFYAGIGYVSQSGIAITSDYKRYSAKLAVDQEVTSWMKFGADVNYRRTVSHDVPDNNNGRFGGFVAAALTAPMYGPIKDSNGYYASIPLSSGILNPLGDIYQRNTVNTVNGLMGNANLQINLPLSITYKSIFGVQLDNMVSSYFMDPTKTTQAASINGQGGYFTTELIRYTWDNTLNYSKRFNDHNINFVVGSSYIKNSTVSSAQEARNFVNGVTRLAGASTWMTNSTSSDAWQSMSYFGRLQYDYKGKYLASASLRQDGSSRFGINNKHALFPAVSLGWRLSSESFIQRLNFFDDLKLRASWGVTGNTPTNSYPSYSQLSVGANYPYDGSAMSNGVVLSNLAGNPDLKWEHTNQYNIGIDLAIFNHRLGFTADYYNKRTHDLIFLRSLPLSTGQSYKYVNIPDAYIQNSGIEFSLNGKPVENKNFTWSSNFNVSFNKNIVQNLSDADIIYDGSILLLNATTSITKSGYALGSFYGYVSNGVDPKTGDMKFQDLDHNGVIDSKDRTVIGSPQPKAYYGFSNEFSYKNFSLNVLIDGVQGNKVFNATKLELTYMSDYSNQSTDVLGRWKQSNDASSLPRAVYGDPTGNARISSRYLEDGSFLRLRNVTLGYNLPKAFCEKIKVSGVSFYGGLQNLFVLTKYSGYSPDLNAGNSSTTVQGFDLGTYPKYKSVTVGANIQL